MSKSGKNRSTKVVIAARKSLVAQLSDSITSKNSKDTENDFIIELYLLQMPSEQVLLRSILPNLIGEEGLTAMSSAELPICQLFPLCSNWSIV